MSAKCHEQTSYASAGSRSRTRDRGGEIRKKRSDTLVRTVREEYGDHFASGYRPNDKLGKVLEKEGVESLHQLLKKRRLAPHNPLLGADR